MKKFLFYAAAVALALTSCQQEDFQPSIAADGEGNFNITIDAPEAMGSTRTYTLGSEDALFGPQSTSALGGLTNIDWSQYDLRYKVVVYQKNAVSESSYDYVPVLTRTEIVDTYQGITMSFRLTTNRTYRVVAWADFVTQGTTDDLHYNTSDLTHVTCLDDTDHMLNDESRDAYYARRDYTIGGEDQNVNILLRRPFAKIRFVTTDWALDNLEMPDEFTVTYKNCSRYYGFNALTGGGTDLTGLGDTNTEYTVSCKGKINKDVKEYALNYDQTDRNRTLVVDYLFAGAALNAIHMDFTPKGLTTRSIDVDIPTRQNFLTTILGNLLTGNMSVTFEVEEIFRNEYNDFYLTANNVFTASEPAVDDEGAYLISSPNELVWLQELINSADRDPSIKVKLIKDIDLEGYHWTPMNYNGGESNMLTFDGQGHKVININITTDDPSYSKYAGFFSNIYHGVVKNLTIDNFTSNNSPHCVGGIVGVLHGSLENCTVNHIFMRQKNHDAQLALYYNYGGMVGIWYAWGEEHAAIKNCHAVDVNLQTAGRCGGIVGFLHTEGTDYPRTFENCSVREVFLNDEVYPGFVGYDYWFQCTGSIAGYINTDEITFRNCSQSDCTYVFGYGKQENMVYLHTGDEGGEFTYNDSYTGSVVKVGPEHKFYGYSAVRNLIYHEE